MTTPEPVSPEVRRSPDGRLIAYCRSARHGLWRKSDGYDCDTEDVADWTPLVPAVSPAPDTDELRPLVEAAVRQGIKDWDRDYDSRACGPITNYVLGALDYALRTREAGLRADLDRLTESARTLALARNNLREDLAAARAALAGARTIPDDAAEQIAAWLAGRFPASLDGSKHRTAARGVLKLVNGWLSTPTTDPAPAAADGPRVWAEGDPEPKGVTEVIGGRTGRRWHRESDPHTYGGRWISGAVTGWCAWPTLLANERRATEVLPPAAPQAPAEPTEETAFGALLAAAGDLDGGTDADRRLAEHIRSAVAEVAGEDAATPPLPLHEQADLLTWRVVHVPPGTTDREDTDTPITPGWWLVGHGDDPDHPDVQVHLGDRLPTSSAATPGDEYNDDLGGWACRSREA